MAIVEPIRVAYYVFRKLADRGVGRDFIVSDGKAMHLNDTLGQESRLPAVCKHDE
jgi:hypothetical protein